MESYSKTLNNHHPIKEVPNLIHKNHTLSVLVSHNLIVYLWIQYIHKLGSRISRSKEILDGLYWGGDFNEITRLINNNKISEDQIRFFIGYSGWEAFQLQKEIKEKSWIISQTTSEECLAYSDANFWSKLIKKQDNKYKIWANLPRNPNLN